MSIKDDVKSLVLKGFEEIDNAEKIHIAVGDFRLRLKAKIVAILSSFTQQEIKETTFNEVIEGINEALTDITKKVDYENLEKLEKEIEFFEALNEVLKEFIDSKDIKDKHELSMLMGKVSKLIERMRLEIKEKRGGILKRIRNFIFRK